MAEHPILVILGVLSLVLSYVAVAWKFTYYGPDDLAWKQNRQWVIGAFLSVGGVVSILYGFGIL